MPKGLDEWAAREFGAHNVERWQKEKEAMRKRLFGTRAKEPEEPRRRQGGAATKPGRRVFKYKGEKDFWGAVERGDWAAAAKAMGREWE